MILFSILTACTGETPSAPESPEPVTPAPAPLSAEECTAAIEVQDGIMAQLEPAAAQRQPWDELAVPFPLPVVDTPLVHRSDTALQVERSPEGTWSIGGTPLDLSDSPALACADVKKNKAMSKKFGASFSMALFAEPGAPTSDVKQMLGLLERCGVDQIDLVVGRTDPPKPPEVAPPNPVEAARLALFSKPPSLDEQVDLSKGPPPLMKVLAPCPLVPGLGEIAAADRPAAMRSQAREALTECKCAIDPALYPWAFRLKYIPARYTNVLPAALPVALDGATWQESVTALASK